MSRQLRPNIPPAELRLWRFETQIVPFLTANLRVQIFGPGTNMAEFIYMEADLANLDFIAVGLSNVQLFAAAATGTKCIAQLAPGDSIRWQQQGNAGHGNLTAQDGDVASLTFVPELDRIDASQLWAISGPNNIPNTLHVTIGQRGR